MRRPLTSTRLLVGLGVVLFVATIGLWVFWLDRIVYFNTLSVMICLVTSPLLAAVVFVLGVRRRNPRLRFTIMDSLQEAISLLAVIVVAEFFVLSLLVFFSSTRPGDYIASYEYTSAGKGCSGLKVYDRELEKRIRICHPDALRAGGKVRVEKLSGPLGIAVKRAELL